MRMSVGEGRRVKEGEEHTRHLSPDNGCEPLHSTSSHRTHAHTHARTHACTHTHVVATNVQEMAGVLSSAG